MNRAITLCTLIITVLVAASCERVDATKSDRSSPEMAKRNDLRNRYQYAPREEIFDGSEPSKRLLSDLRAKYRSNLDELRKSVESNKSKLLVMYVSPEFGGKMYTENGPFIKNACAELGIDYVDFTATLEGRDPTSYTQLPKDGHFSKAGSELIATMLEKALAKYGDHRSDVKFQDSERPKTLGDFDAGSDEIKGNEKDLPYRVKINGQGLRMDADVAFPKTKQRILILGDSQMYFPYLDNAATAPAILQAKFPEKEFLNAATFGYSIDDHLSLFNEKGRFAEPDIVIVATNGGDITDLFFSHRNIYSRRDMAFEPTAGELEYYPRVTAR